LSSRQALTYISRPMGNPKRQRLQSIHLHISIAKFRNEYSH